MTNGVLVSRMPRVVLGRDAEPDAWLLCDDYPVGATKDDDRRAGGRTACASSGPTRARSSSSCRSTSEGTQDPAIRSASAAA